MWERLEKPPWRTILLLLGILAVPTLAYLAWSPGMRIHDGRHDLRTNGIWLQHGWLGDDAWFDRNRKDRTLFRDDRRIQGLADLLAGHGVRYVFPHLCPCNSSGTIALVDPAQTERFLDRFGNFVVLPWIGGVLDRQCFLASPPWRMNFASSVVDLLRSHPRLAGVQINIEPLPTGNADFLTLLDEVRQAMPGGMILSVAAYPPPTRWHPFPDVHWEESYFRQVARRVDQLAPMMYDTGLGVQKLYQNLMADWTSEILNWSGKTQVLFGIPAYEDAGVGYHDPGVENLGNALSGIHAGLKQRIPLPDSFAGVAIYCEWEMDQKKWDDFWAAFERAR